jgi:hypothetical protein
MRFLIAAGIACACSSPALAGPPGQDIVNACLLTQSTPKTASYKAVPARTFHQHEVVDADTGITTISTTVKHGRERVGLAETRPGEAYRLLYNGAARKLDDVIRINPQHAPADFVPTKAMYGIIRSGRSSYFCITFNFDGLGSSGAYQYIRAIYLIDRDARGLKAFYSAADIRKLPR